MAKSKGSEQIKFIRAKLRAQLVQAGHSEEDACEIVDMVPDSEICKEIPSADSKKMKALGDGTILRWLRDHKEEIKNGVDRIFSLLSLLGVLKAGDKK